jgi:menaquinol-cytochrome c reductase iron-sulfur subunit
MGHAGTNSGFACTNKSMSEPEVSLPPANPSRRRFVEKAVATIIGVVILLVPTAAGLAILLDPLRRKVGKSTFMRVTTLGAVPTDGTFRKFDVFANRSDAWNTFPNTRVGAVYLARKDGGVIAFNVRCPHLGCFVDAVKDGFACPCHDSRFNADGSVIAGSVAPRGLDELEVDPEALKAGIVQIRFQNFAAGTAERISRT